ncbi:MAG: hypothetical protein ACRC80_31970 [Waterburya sp.]
MDQNQIEKVAPVVVENIEFYCSRDGLRTGMSQRGLAIFANVHPKSVYNVLKVLDSGATERLPEWLKPWKLVGVFHEEMLGSKNNGVAQILKSDFCADYIEQLAFHPDKPNEGALTSFRKFARIGIGSFIKDVTGYRDLSSSQEDIATILGIVKSMEKKLDAASGFFTAKIHYPALEEICKSTGLTEEEEVALLLPPVEKLLTLNECVQAIYPNMILSKTQKHSLAILTGQAYKTLKLGSPKKVIRRSAKGSNLPPVYGYPERMLGTIKLLITTMLATS